jgi:hypothetical protein
MIFGSSFSMLTMGADLAHRIRLDGEFERPSREDLESEIMGVQVWSRSISHFAKWRYLSFTEDSAK